MIPAANFSYLWDVVVKPRIGVAPYSWDGSFDPNNVSVGTDCSGAVSAELCALVYGPSGMIWARQFWTGTFAGANAGDHGPFGGVECTRNLVCIASPNDAPADAAMIIAVLQNPDPTSAHMICQVQGINIEMGGPNNSYSMGVNATDIHNSEFNQWFYLPGGSVTQGITQQTGLDYSAGRLPGADVKANGYSFACRYLFDGSPDLPFKLLTAPEASDLQANGIGIVSNFESTADSALGGFNQGIADAQQADANHLAAGGPPGRPIYFSVDFDVAENQQPAINQYFQGVASVIGLARTGIYGGYWPVKRCLDAGVVTWAWQAEAWSSDPNNLPPVGLDGDYLDPRANILQRNNVGFVTINGVQCDVNESQTADFGQWNYTSTGGFLLSLSDQEQSDVHTWLGDIHGGLFNQITSKSPFRTLGEGAIWQQHELPINDDGFIHPNYVEHWAINYGDPYSIKVLQHVASGDPTQFPDRADDIALAQRVLAKVPAQFLGGTPPAAPTVKPAVFAPTPAPVPLAAPTRNITITMSQLIQWGRDAMTVLGAIATYATAAHDALGQFLPGASGTVVPVALAAVTTGFGAHAVVQKKAAKTALANLLTTTRRINNV